MAKYNYAPGEKEYVRKAAFYSQWTFVGGAPQVMQAKSFAVALKPGLDVFYKDDPEKELSVLLEHADTYVNSHTVGLSLMEGIVLAMEKERAEKGTITPEAIASIKAALMGPTAGIGDSFYFNCVRVIAAGIGIGLVGEGSILGAIVFLAIFGGITVASKHLLFRYGYEQGAQLVDGAFQSGMIPLVSKAASILGLVMVGALVASNVKIAVKLAPVIGGATINFQSLFDAVAPGILKIALWWIIFKGLQKGKTPMQLIWIMMGSCIVLAALHIL